MNLPDKEADILAEIQAEDELTATEIVRKSILTQKFLRDEQKVGHIVMLEDHEGNRREIHFL